MGRPIRSDVGDCLREISNPDAIDPTILFYRGILVSNKPFKCPIDVARISRRRPIMYFVNGDRISLCHKAASEFEDEGDFQFVLVGLHYGKLLLATVIKLGGNLSKVVFYQL